MMATKEADKQDLIGELFKAGAHFGFVKSRRHPSAKPFIFGNKDKIEIFDLELSANELMRAIKFMEDKGKDNTQFMVVGGKSEARAAVEKFGHDLGIPYVASRWIGGTLTNWNEIKKRLQRLEDLTVQKERGELAKYTKKERLLIDREIEGLVAYFGGISTMKSLPKFMVVVDPAHESIAVAEAKKIGIPVVGIAGTDNNLNQIVYPIPVNDSSRATIALVLGKLANAYKRGQENAEKINQEKSK